MKIQSHYNLLATDTGIKVGGGNVDIQVSSLHVPKDLALQIHQEVAAMGWCRDTECPCFEHGVEAEREQSHEH